MWCCSNVIIKLCDAQLADGDLELATLATLKMIVKKMMTMIITISITIIKQKLKDQINC